MVFFVGTVMLVCLQSRPIYNKSAEYHHINHSQKECSLIMTVTMYNVGDPAQTDDTPCIGASNLDLCELIKKGVKVCATNDFPLGTELTIQGMGTCYVLDRMNPRFTGKHYLDYALPPGLKEDALRFGKQKILVYESNCEKEEKEPYRNKAIDETRLDVAFWWEMRKVREHK